MGGIPVVVIRGMLEAGKTAFIKESIINKEIEIPSNDKQLEVWIKQNNYKF